MGVTAARAVREPATAAVRGVFAADLYLDEIAAYLATVAIGRTGRVFLLTDEGRLVAGPQPAAAEQMPPVVATALGALPRPLATLETNESSPVTVAHDGVRYVVVFTHSDLTSGLDWITATVVPEEEFLGPAQHNVRIAAGVGLGAFVLALFLAYHIAHRIARPLGTIATDLERVGQFQLSATPAPRSFIQEIGVVSDAVDRMKASLRSFGRYVPTELVRELLARGEEARLGGETRTLTIFFSDIENFTHLSEALPPAVVVQHLADYLDWMTATIRAHAGIVNQFVGDGIMAFWNAPQPVADHAAQACRAALHAQQGLRTLQAQWAAAGTPVFRTRIGLHTGEALVGNVGTRERFTYTAMGDTTNLASRLEGLNKQYGTQILASEAVRAAAGPDFEWRRLDRVAVVGRREETVVYELLGERDAVPDTILHARDLYEQALAAYFAGDFAAATAGFRAAAAAHPADKAAVVMEARAEHLTAHPPDSGWNGVYVASNK
jgi:adenylate cyclase